MLLRISLPFVLVGTLCAQFPGLTLPPSGKNQKAAVSQNIGPVKLTIEYSSPAVHGPDGKDRRGQIWGKLVPYGLTDLGYGNGKPGPWRAGANENTVFEASNDVVIEGQPLAAGRYGLHMIAGPEEWTIIFSKNSRSWGSFFYEDSEDALRVKVKPHKHDYREWLTYEFTERRPEKAVAELQWEELAVPWTVEVKNIKDIYISRLTEDLANQAGFYYQGYLNAANFCTQNDACLDQALKWTEKAIGQPFIGQKNFDTLSAKAQVLSKMGRKDEAKALMQEALQLPGTTALQIHMFGRQLLTQNQVKEAVAVFELNAKRNGDAWPVHVGLARAYAAAGENQKALEHAKKALPQAPDELNRKNLESMVQTLSEGKSITQ
jgi:hypothetical protein